MKTRTILITENLNSSQLYAVQFTEKPLLVLAGAGSGKTRVITCKIAHLIQNGFSPHKILAITFTKKAANEMKDRVFSLTGIQSKWISTFHSFCLRVLREHVKKLNNGLRQDFIVYDEDDSKKLFEKICRDRYYNVDPDTLFNKISRLRQFGEVNSSNFEDHSDYEIYRLYEQALIDCNAVDFDNIQLFACKLLENPDIRRIYREKFDYILIDEFQDTSPVQYKIVKLVTKNGNVTAVGDPQQSIYAFRGAVVENVIRFKMEFTPFEIKLEENYRSGRSILQVANTVSELIDDKWKSLVVSLKSIKSESGTVRATIHENEFDEALWIVKNTRFLLEELESKEIAILVRARYVKSVIKEKFRQAQIPLDDVDDYDFFKRAEIRDVLSYLRFACNPEDFIAFERAITTPPRGIGRKTIKQISSFKQTDYIQASKSYAATIRGEKSRMIMEFVRFIEYLRELLFTPAEALKTVITNLNYREYLKTKYRDTWEDRYASLIDLYNILKRYSSFQEFLDDSLLYEDRKERNMVKLMTVHSAKGLEFDAVFLPALECEIFPDKRNTLDEEIRCFYVAVTRARKYLFLSACNSRRRDGKFSPSGPGKFFEYMLKKLKERS